MPDLLRIQLGENDRRSFTRALKLISGCLIHDEQRLNCMIVDLSINGARLLFDRPLPDFDEDSGLLSLSLRMASPVDLPMKIVWRDGMLMGAEFLMDPADVAVALEPLLPKECLKS